MKIEVFRGAIWCQAILCLGGLLGCDRQRYDIRVFGPRPVSAALDELRDRHQLIASYEDPMYIYRPGMAFLDGKNGERGAGLIPAPRRLRFVYNENDLREPISFIEDLVSSAQHIDTRFKVIRKDDLPIVVPSEKRDKRGNWASTQSVLAVRITLGPVDGSGLDLIEALLDKVTQASGTPTAFGMAPVNVFAHKITSIEAKEEIARDVLLKILERLGFSFHGTPDIFWRLLCDPGVKECYLNLDMTGR